jgi:TIR domain
MADKIFISYRRAEAIKDARALFERLAREFGEERVFIDVDGIEPGEDFVAYLHQQLEGCAALVVVIGPGWASGRRLHNEYDFVRLEVGTSLERGIKVFPVLINGAANPVKEDLPESLHPLLTRQVTVLDDNKFNADVLRLAGAIRRAIDKPPPLKVKEPVPVEEPIPNVPPKSLGQGRLSNEPQSVQVKGAAAVQAVHGLPVQQSTADSAPSVAAVEDRTREVRQEPPAKERAGASSEGPRRSVLARLSGWFRSRWGLTVVIATVSATFLRFAGQAVVAWLVAIVGGVALIVFHRRNAGVWPFQRDIALLCIGIMALAQLDIAAVLLLWLVFALIGGAVVHFTRPKSPSN